MRQPPGMRQALSLSGACAGGKSAAGANRPEHGPTVAALPLARHAAGHTRVWADVEALHDRSADLTRLGIDEIS